jgi:hypothetical protein
LEEPTAITAIIRPSGGGDAPWAVPTRASGPLGAM